MLDKTVGCIENFYDCLWGRVKMYETNQNIYDIVVKPLLKDNLSIDETLTKSYYINMQKFFSNNLFLFYPEICAFIYKNELLGISTGHLLKAIEPQACNIFNNTLNRDIFEHRNKFIKYFNGDSYDMLSLSPEYYDINKKGINKIIDLMFDNYKPYFEYFYENIQNNNKYLFETPEKLEVLKMNLIFEVISKYSYFIRGELYQYNCMYNNYAKCDYTLNLSKISLIAERQALCLIINYIPNQSFNTESLTNYFYQCEPECPHKMDIKDLVSRNKHIVPFYETNFLMLAEVKYINNLKIQIN